jgi:hypothetical protein
VGLPRDNGILRTAAQYNNVHVGVYASVLHSPPAGNAGCDSGSSSVLPAPAGR